MKNFSKTLVALSMAAIAHAQEFGDVNLDILIAQLPNSEKSIDVVYHKQKMYYINADNKQKLFRKGFDVAYPFFSKSALVQNDGKYGIIDLKGNFLIPPSYNTAELAPFDHESHIVLFEGGKIFNLQTGKETDTYLHDEEPAAPKWNIFKAKNNKYGIKKKYSTLISAKYDSIVGIGTDFIIARQKGKIGVLDFKENTIADFSYEDAIYTFSPFNNRISNTFGLKKDKNWVYFKQRKKILESKYQCNSFITHLPNSIGIFSKKGKQNILFEDGTTLKKCYDFIAENGLIAIRKGNIYLLKNDRSQQLYYRKK